MGISWKIASLAVDAGTGACAAVNSAYFLHRLTGREEQRASRRVALGVLVVLSMAALLEAALLSAAAVGGTEAGVIASEGWALVRTLALAGTAGITALIARRAAG